jgi:uncharacterized protein
MYIHREIEDEVKKVSALYPVVTITGPRQSGKTTLARNLFPQKAYFNLETPDIRQAIQNDPVSFLKQNPNGAIIDEIQRIPELVSYIQPIVDETGMKGQYILTGSNQFSLINTISQSLAGRTAIIKLLPFTIQEALTFDITSDQYSLMYKGFYPGIYSENLPPTTAYRNYYETYIERDIRQLINIGDLSLFQKFIRLCVGRAGSLFNMSQLANETGVSVKTIQSWVSVLEASYLIFFLQPWFAKINKRLIKTPKLYFYDVGLACFLLGIESPEQLARDPLCGLLFENMIVIDLLKQRFNKGYDSNLFFFRDSHGNEIDVVLSSGSFLKAIEIKSAETFHIEFLKTLNYLKKLLPEQITNTYLVYSGKYEYPINEHKLINFKNCNLILID